MKSSRLMSGLRALQVFISVTILALSAAVANWYMTGPKIASPTEINFLIFLPLFTLFVVAYCEITPRFAPRASHPYSHFALELTTTIFFFSGFVALSVFLSKLLFCRGIICAAARADAVLAGASFGLWVATTTILGMEIFKGGMRGTRGNSHYWERRGSGGIKIEKQASHQPQEVGIGV